MGEADPIITAVSTRLAAKPQQAVPDCVYTIHLTGPDERIVNIHVRGGYGRLSTGAPVRSDCRITLSLETVKGLMQGTVNPVTAALFGRIRIDGDPAVAARLGQLLRP